MFTVGDAISAFRRAYPSGGRSLYLRWDVKRYRKGDRLPHSRRWIDGKPMKKVLIGTSVLSPRARLSRSGQIAAYEGHVYVVSGTRIRSGQDEGEVILQDARVVKRLL